MSRLFDGVDDVMTYPISASGGADWRFGTLLIVCRILNTGDTAWLSFLEAESAGNAQRYSMGRRNDGRLYLVDSDTGSLQSAVTIEDADNWAIYAVTKATGSVAATMHKIPLATGTRTSTAAGSAQADGKDASGGELRLGGPSDFANIRVAAAAVFPGVVLTTTQLDGIASAKTTASIAALSPTWLVDDSDGLATDLIGTADRTAIVGTADDADDPAGWVYGLGGSTDATVDLDTADLTLDATGDIPNPAVTTPDATVTSPPMDALGSIPITGMVISVEVTTPAAQATGDTPDPTVTGSGNQDITAPTADALADVPAPGLLADSATTSPTADATGDTPAPTLAAAGTATSPALDAQADLPAPIAGEPVDRLRNGQQNTGIVEITARQTGITEPAHFTGIAEPSHTTGITEVLSTTGVLEVAI